MQYTWNNRHAFDMVSVPKAAAEQMKLATALQLRVLMWLCCIGGGKFDADMCAQDCGASADLCKEALDYWVSRDIVCVDGTIDGPKPISTATVAAEPPPPISVVTVATPKTEVPVEREMPTRLQVIERKESDVHFSFLLEQAAVKLGRVLSPADMSLYLYLYRDLKLPPEVILMIIGYAVKNGRAKLAYIEKTAIGWAENGITTFEAADAYLCRLERCAQAWEQVKACCALDIERPSVAQKEAAYRWVFEWEMPKDVITYAVSYAAEKTGKFQASYADRVLERLHGLGIVTVDAAKAELTTSTKPKKKKGAAMKTAEGRPPSFDISAYEEMTRRHRPRSLKRED